MTLVVVLVVSVMLSRLATGLSGTGSLPPLSFLLKMLRTILLFFSGSMVPRSAGRSSGAGAALLGATFLSLEALTEERDVLLAASCGSLARNWDSMCWRAESRKSG